MSVYVRIGRWLPLLAGAGAVLLCSAGDSLAVPACPGPVTIEQPDGTSITIQLKGDEKFHWNEDGKGHVIVRSADSGAWVYATAENGAIVPTEHEVGKVDADTLGIVAPDMAAMRQAGMVKASAARGAAPPINPTATTGTQQNLVVLVNFSDVTIPYTTSAYSNLFNQIGYTTDGASGSVKDYYLEASYNALTVASTVVNAVTLSNNMAYYGGNDIYGYDLRPREMVAEALALLEAGGFNFAPYDGDSDGWVDGLTVIHAGGGEEYSGNNANYIWSHQWQMINTVTYDGVSMLMYHTEPARRGWDSVPSTWGITRIGVICHENGHFLGLPDLYDYGYDSYGAGDFCLMAGGSWNGNYGTQPAHFSAYCKDQLNWVTPTVITTPGTYTIGQVETNAQIYKIQGNLPYNEYFLLENRQGAGFDASLPGTTRGMLIWHVDTNQTNNDDQTHYMVDLEEASGTQHLANNSNSGDDADYFRNGTMTTLNATTTPNNNGYGATTCGIDITSVSNSSSSMQFTTTGSVQSKDWGDAPDPTYPTLAASMGASHVIVPGMFLGALIDPEPNGIPHPQALGDDTSNLPDEDGVAFTSPIAPNATVTLTVTASMPGLLNAWIDFNADGNWGTPGDQIFINKSLAAGVNNLSFVAPPTAIVGMQTFARFRFSSQGGLQFFDPVQPAPDGEVEDYMVFIEEPEEIDWGDAPDPAYPTLNASTGANHKIQPGMFLGNLIDFESDGQPHPNALGDDMNNQPDEDGVAFVTPLQPGLTATVDVMASMPGLLNAWVDFNADGSWATAGDQILTDVPVNPGLNSISFTVPFGATPSVITFARFRYDTLGGLSYTGAAQDGEVEDYEVPIDEAPPRDPQIEFSLDIGSDTELSDPNADGDEGFDPGDVYWWSSSPLSSPVLPGGRDGFKNDEQIFGSDPMPDPPDPATAVPVGSNGDPNDEYPSYFDLDGHDQIDKSLHQELNLEGMPLQNPISAWASPCIYDPEFVMVSFDDDMRDGWPVNDVPVIVSSPAGLVYGMTANRDEVFGTTLAPFGTLPAPPTPVISGYPIASEIVVHLDMAPNPDTTEDDDDDVDSLDVVPDGDTCPHWYFSPDHEAHLGLDPGDIYEVITPGPAYIRVIDEVANLGLPDEADVDAFEFTWFVDADGTTVLGVLFSVDDNDALTPGDESGGLMPNWIYGSILTGSWFVVSDDTQFVDDIDAITIWEDEIHPDPPVMINAVSRKHHITGVPGGAGDAGNWDINLFPNYDVESRSAELQTAGSTSTTLLIEVKFDKSIVLLGLAGGDVVTDTGSVTGVTQVAADLLQVNMSGVPFTSKLRLWFPGVANAASPVSLNACSDQLCVGVLVGDYDQTLAGAYQRTNFLDFAKVKAAGYINQLVNTVDKARADFDCTGRPTFLDFSRVKVAGQINKGIIPCP